MSSLDGDKWFYGLQKQQLALLNARSIDRATYTRRITAAEGVKKSRDELMQDFISQKISPAEYYKKTRDVPGPHGALVRGLYSQVFHDFITRKLSRSDFAKSVDSLYFNSEKLQEHGVRINMNFTINTSQRNVLIYGAILFVGMLVFPPFFYNNGGGELVNAGYHFILDPPKGRWEHGAMVDLRMLFTQWLCVIVAASAGLFYFGTGNKAG